MSDVGVSNEQDALSLSFLDVLSCGLGASVLLFLAFSLVGEDRPLTASSPNFLYLEANYDRTAAVVRLFVTPPDGDRFSLCVEDNRQPCDVTLETGDVWKPYGDPETYVLATTTDRDEAEFHLRAFQPRNGVWRFELRYDARRKVSLSQFGSAEDMDVELRVGGRDAGRRRLSGLAGFNQLVICGPEDASDVQATNRPLCRVRALELRVEAVEDE